jgi:3-deoxy-manno-octulosonate cytidylyltransferase (CMP-KDO synthetase)
MSAVAGRFTALIPARIGSTRLPRKALADLAGVPMVVRVAQRATAAGAARTVVCTDAPEIAAACAAHGVEAVLTAQHPTGTDRLAQACTLLGLAPATIVVNIQGDEPLFPLHLPGLLAARLAAQVDCDIATPAHPITQAAEFFNPNVVKVVIDARERALLFSRAPIPWARDAFSGQAGAAAHFSSAHFSDLPPGLPAWRHVGLYAYRCRFLLRYPGLPRPPLELFENLEQLRALCHGVQIAVVPIDDPLPPGVDTAEDLEEIRRILSAGSAP